MYSKLIVWIALVFINFTPLLAATLVVDNTSDALLSACTASANDCSLRGAITAANANVGDDVIEFVIPSSDPGFISATTHWRIDALTALPPIEGNTLINGYSQTGAQENTNSPDQGGSNAILKIELRNQSGSAINGLETSGNFFNAQMVVRGLAINQFSAQIMLNGGAANRVEGCFLGTDISGMQGSLTGNAVSGTGVQLQGSGAYVIGGLDAAARNVIAAVDYGILALSGPDGIRVQGNVFGLNATANALIGMRSYAFYANSVRNTLIGGDTPAARNIVSGSGFEAIYLSADGSQNSRIQGNYFGTDWQGRLRFGNGYNPASPSQTTPTITLFGGAICGIQIGGLGAGEGNLIAHSVVAGVHVGGCTGVAIVGNRFVDNAGLAIDNSLGSIPDGPTANDAGDADIGGNRLQNFAQINLPSGFLPSGGSSVTLDYLVDTTLANASYPLTLMFYRNQTQLLATDTYSSAQQLRQFILQSGDGSNVLPLSALVVDSAGNTSEFSPLLGISIFANGFE